MSASKLSKTWRSIQRSLSKHSPEILTGMGIAGMITATVLAVKATPKALFLIEAKEVELKMEHSEKLPPIEVVKTAWKCYIPTAVTGSLSIACLVGGSATSVKRNAALATAYSLSESALKEYSEKVVEKIGFPKEQEIRESISKDKVEKNPVNSKEVIITEKGGDLCFDPLSGRYFKSSVNRIKASIVDLNYRMMDEMRMTVNDFYYEIGLDPVDNGDERGWRIEDGKIDIMIDSVITEDGTLCAVLDYHRTPPRPNIASMY